MFSFHKPRVYRTLIGCCICKAKSSSSRFTDSLKYENEFRVCFQLSAQRQGVICNACVLLVKRFKRLPAGSARHWGHVVDARAGPGMKCMNKFKKKHDKKMLASERLEKRETSANVGADNVPQSRQLVHFLRSKSDLESTEESSGSDEDCILLSAKQTHPPMVHEKAPRNQRKGSLPVKNKARTLDQPDTLDSSYWKRETVCCGVVWKGANSEIIINPELYKPCPIHRTTPATQTSLDSEMSLQKPSADYSSDSGYHDDSSNPAQILMSLNSGD